MFMSALVFGQDVRWKGTTSLIGSYYHVGSYSKERPFAGVEQLFEVQPFDKWSFGIGTGFNLYPANATFPFFATVRYTTSVAEKWEFFYLQSYGRNIKYGSIGFNSNRLYGEFGFPFILNNKLRLSPGMGWLMNLDRFGGKSLSFTGSVGLSYYIN